MERRQSCREEVEATVADRQRSETDWGEYFNSIKQECPWSYIAWQRGQIEVVDWDGEVKPLGNFQARVYIVDTDNETLEKMSDELDQGEYEWLFSHPGFGPFAAPQKILIQQLRARLTELRSKL